MSDPQVSAEFAQTPIRFDNLMKYTITKSFRFDSAHSLPHLCDGHQCKRLHGHSYKLIVGVSGPLVNEWVQDYADISGVVKPLVDRLDHQFLNDILPFITTAENLAAWFWSELSGPLPLLSRIEIRETASDFWNLAGRAGRWGTEFQGSIVCVDALNPKVWPVGPPVRRVRQKIQGSTETSLSDAGGLLAYIESGFPAVDGLKHPEYDYAASFLLSVLARGERLETIPTTARLPEGERVRLTAALEAEIGAFALPRELIFRNPGVLPRSMMELLTYFRGLTPEQFAEHIPVLPESDDAVERYNKILTFINDRLRGNIAAAGAGTAKRLWQLAYLTVDWMRGRPLSMLIRTRESISARATGGVQNLPALIRGVMSDVEEYARFKIPRFLRCYLGVLKAHAHAANLGELVQNLPDLELWLELGVSVKTALSLMELGLSRTSAVELFEAMTNTEMSPSEVLAWLRDRDLETLDLPGIMRDEIRRVLARHASA